MFFPNEDDREWRDPLHWIGSSSGPLCASTKAASHLNHPGQMLVHHALTPVEDLARTPTFPPRSGPTMAFLQKVLTYVLFHI